MSIEKFTYEESMIYSSSQIFGLLDIQLCSIVDFVIREIVSDGEMETIAINNKGVADN